MPTRAAAKREAAFLQESQGAVTLPSPPTTPAVNDKDVHSNGTPRDAKLNVPNKVRQSKRKVAEPVKGGWDVLPHGLSKKGDLEESNEITIATKSGPATPESIATGTEIDPVTTELLQEAQPKKRGRMAKQIKTEDDEEVKDEDFEGEKPKKKRAQRKRKAVDMSEDVDIHDEAVNGEIPKKKRTPRKGKAVDTSKDVLDNVDDLIDAAGSVPKKERKKKAHPYGLTPGESPFPNHAMPTPEACEEVTRLLSEAHGAVQAPKVIPPPSMEVTGCGEVPDLLDAILRTLLSASTTANNANMAIQGLKDAFGLCEFGVGKGSVNWEAVHQAKLPDVIESIKRGGLAVAKGTNIKKILDVVYKQNCERRDALLKEKETGESADIPGAKHESPEQKDTEIANVDKNLLSMDYVFEMTTDEAMDEMTKLPGIGVKTASCVVLFCMQRPSFAVDTHVWRHCKWLGWVPDKATRDQTFSHCEVRVPDHLKYPLHQFFLRHGKTCGRCRANTSPGSEEWEKTACPIEHLVNRTGKRKGPAAPGKAKKTKKGKKADDDETEESEVEMDDAMSD